MNLPPLLLSVFAAGALLSLATIGCSAPPQTLPATTNRDAGATTSSTYGDTPDADYANAYDGGNGFTGDAEVSYDAGAALDAGADADAANASATVPCGDKACTADQFCAENYDDSNNGATDTFSCRPIPTSCTSCDCLDPSYAACLTFSCDHENGRFSVRCTTYTEHGGRH